MPEWPVYLRGIGVEQQFCGVEPQAMFGGINAVGAVAISRTGAGLGNCQPVNVILIAPHWQTRRLFFARRIKKAKVDL
ncbi:hypothetical protein D3C87_1480360 [compost metagenome]